MANFLPAKKLQIVNKVYIECTKEEVLQPGFAVDEDEP